MLRLIRQLSSQFIVPMAWTIVTVGLLCIPGSRFPEDGFLDSVENFDKLIHLVLFGGIVLFWGSFFHLKTKDDRKWFKTLIALTLGVILLGIAMEYVQLYLIPNRDFDKGDIKADMAGAIAGFGYLVIVRKQ
jgi:hypothetical protein